MKSREITGNPDQKWIFHIHRRPSSFTDSQILAGAEGSGEEPFIAGEGDWRESR